VREEGAIMAIQTDYLENLPPEEVAAWYDRLAQFIEKKNTKVTDPLAPKLLRYWRNGRGKKFIFPAPDHLRQSKSVVKVLEYHWDCYLTEKKFKGDDGERWAGVIPRLQGRGYPKWQPFWGRPIYPNLHIHMNSLVEIPISNSLSDGDVDLLTSLHGFQLRTDVEVRGKMVKSPDVRFTFVLITFNMFLARAVDRYDWDPNKHFRVPNPDYNNPFKVPKPVAPRLDEIRVYHTNAIRVEKAGLAWPFDLESEPWVVTDFNGKEAVVDPTKDI
jgi:hypothetical protein